MHFRLCVAMGDISIILEGALGYSWDIHRVFGEYSWDIRMYRVCVGNVSGMYRELDGAKERRESTPGLKCKGTDMFDNNHNNINQQLLRAKLTIVRTK